MNQEYKIYESLNPDQPHSSQGGGMGYTKAKEKFMLDRDNEAEVRNKEWADMTQEEREQDRMNWNLEQEKRNGL